MSIESGKPYNVMNQRAGLSIYLSKDNKSLIGEKFEDSAERQLVCIACPFYSFCRCTHIMLVDPSVPCQWWGAH